MATKLCNIQSSSTIKLSPDQNVKVEARLIFCICLYRFLISITSWANIINSRIIFLHYIISVCICILSIMTLLFIYWNSKNSALLIILVHQTKRFDQVNWISTIIYDCCVEKDGNSSANSLALPQFTTQVDMMHTMLSSTQICWSFKLYLYITVFISY